jgi:dihydrofolate reductase
MLESLAALAAPFLPESPAMRPDSANSSSATQPETPCMGADRDTHARWVSVSPGRVGESPGCQQSFLAAARAARSSASAIVGSASAGSRAPSRIRTYRKDSIVGNLTIDLFSSLDGFAAAEGWPGYWGLEGPELMDHLDEKLAKDQTVVMGATTYRVMSEIVARADDPNFSRTAELPQIVFSSTLQPPLAWSNTRLIAEDAIPTIRALKEEDPTPLVTMGSLSLNRSLLTAGLVDRFRVIIFPVITGDSGREPIYAGMPDISLELVAASTLDGRLQLFEYFPTLHRGDAGS